MLEMHSIIEAGIYLRRVVEFNIGEFQFDVWQIAIFQIPNSQAQDREPETRALPILQDWCGPGIERKRSVNLPIAHCSNGGKTPNIVKEHLPGHASAAVGKSYPSRVVINFFPAYVLIQESSRKSHHLAQIANHGGLVKLIASHIENSK
jgi:hypothetical protein